MERGWKENVEVAKAVGITDSRYIIETVQSAECGKPAQRRPIGLVVRLADSSYGYSLMHSADLPDYRYLWSRAQAWVKACHRALSHPEAIRKLRHDYNRAVALGYGERFHGVRVLETLESIEADRARQAAFEAEQLEAK